MEKPTCEAVLAAIGVLYSDSATNDQTHQASEWLDEFQKSIYAWEISNQLLYVNNDVESSYFASQTMRRKIQSQFGEVPIDHHLALRDSLMCHLEKLHQSPRAMVTQLCLALADLALQSPKWANPAGDIVQKFGNHLHLLPIALELLTVFPEELNSNQVKIGGNRRREVTDHLQSTASSVLALLVHCHKNCPDDEKVQCKIFQCFGSWMTLGFFPPAEVAQSQLLKSAFDALLSHGTSTILHDAVTDCISNALYVSEDLERQYPLAEVCFKFVISLSSSYENALKEEDFDRVLNYARLFTEMAESYLVPMVHTPDLHPENMKILDFILSCIANPNYEVAEVTFGFWFNFSDLLHKEGNKRSYEVLGPYVQRLLVLLCGRCEMEKVTEGVPDSTDEFQEFRFRALEVVEDLAYIIGSAILFNQLLEKVMDQRQSWHVVEAGFFVMCALVRVVPRGEQGPVRALEFLLSLPANVHIAVQYAAVRLAAELSFWVIDRPDVVDTLLQFILSHFQNKQLATVSAHAFETLCMSCAPKLVKHFDVILEVAKAADGLSISTECIVGILKGAAHVLCYLPLDGVKKGLTQLCYPQLTPLNQLLHGGINGHTVDPIPWLDRLAIIFRHTAPEVPDNEDHPCLAVIEEMWPLLSSTAQKYKSEERVMERCCRCLRFAIRCVGQGSVKLLQPLVTQMVTIYDEHQHSCFLYLGSILVDEYGTNSACIMGLIQMLKAFSGPTFRRLSQERGLVQHPDTVDDFFRLCIRLLQHCPFEFLQNDSIDTVFQLAAVSISLDHREANTSVTKFLADTIRFFQKAGSEDKEKLARSLFQKHGANILKGIVNACAGGVQTFMLPEVGDLLWEIMSYDRQHALDWLKEGLNSLPTHSPTGAVVASPQQIAEFYHAVSSADSVKTIWRAFREFSRLFC